MHRPLRLFPLVSILFSFASLFLRLSAQAPVAQIDYTGSLMGYYRMEAFETEPKLAAVKDFLDFRAADSDRDGRLLLGMGDNFGPEFGSSIQMENSDDKDCAQPEKHVDGGDGPPETLYKDDDRFPRRAWCDNVLNFLMRAGFRAVVPGREDFMYTARWLRGAAVQLAEESKNGNKTKGKIISNPEGKLYLLAANLRIAMKGGIPRSRLEAAGKYSLNNRCPLLFNADPFSPKAVSCSSDGSEAEVLDWLDRLDRLAQGGSGTNQTVIAMRELATESTLTAAGRAIELNAVVSDEVAIFRAAWADRFPGVEEIFSDLKLQTNFGKRFELTPDAIHTLKEKLPMPQSPQTNGICQSTKETSADARECYSYAVRLRDILANLEGLPKAGGYEQKCAQGEGAKGACFLLTPETRTAAIHGMLRTIENEQKDVGFTISERNGQKTLIVGVVGKNTMQGVSATNRRLCLGGEVAKQPDHQNLQVVDEHWPADFGSCDEQTISDLNRYHFAANVLVTDPVLVTAAVIRAAELVDGHFDNIVVMAQMPRTDAEVLATRVWARLRNVKADQPLNAVISEAEAGFATPTVKLAYEIGTTKTDSIADSHPAPVLTPVKGYSSIERGFPGTVSRFSLETSRGHNTAAISNQSGVYPHEVKKVDSSISSISLFYDLIKELQNHSPNETREVISASEKSKTELMLLEALQRSGRHRADAVLLQSRDIQADAIGRFEDSNSMDYSDYSICPADQKQNLCKLHIALDRILWKGDYLEYVAVTGKSVLDLIDASDQKMQQQMELADRDIGKEWLVSYGLVQSSLVNTTEVSQNNEPLWIPIDPSCHGSSSEHTYCIGGSPIVPDSYYWILTTDQLAQDDIEYKILKGLPTQNHLVSRMFLTHPLAEYILGHLEQPGLEAASNWVPYETKLDSGCPKHGASAFAASVEKTITCANEAFQQFPIWQIDFAKFVASFTSRMPNGGNQFVGEYFQSVADPRASAPSSQELDIELANRISGSFFTPESAFSLLSFGFQSNFAYDRSVLGNLTPTTKPINASYALNNLTVGAFAQISLSRHRGGDPVRAVRSLPHNLFVFSPRQYQIQIDHPYLFFPFAQSSPVPGELTISLPRTNGWTDRAGYRREFGQTRPGAIFLVGSYLEAGGEFNSQNNVLAALTLQTGSTTKTCEVSARYSLQTCFSQSPALVINNTTALIGSPAVKTLHTPGMYWSIHLQNRLFTHMGSSGPSKQISLITDTTGDYYFGRPDSAELPTQTQYAIPLSLSLNIPALGNLSFAPTYSAFFYKPQLSNQSLLVNSVSIAARWYFARDARVPVRWQVPLPGPQSSDQTRTGKAH